MSKSIKKGFQIWKDCTKCHGSGVVLDFGSGGLSLEDMREPFPDPMPIEIVCPLCKGAKQFPWGWLDKEVTEEV